MAKISTLETRLEANIIKFEEKMKRVDRLTGDVTSRIKRKHDQAADSVSRTWQKADLDKGFQRQIKSVNGLRDSLMTLAPALAAALSMQGAIAAADTFTRFTNQLKISGLAGEDLIDVQNRLFETAKNAGIGVEALGTLYARISASGKDLSATQTQVQAATDAVALSLKVSGSSAESAQGALLQLGQALGSPIIQASEYNSLVDGMPALMQAMAAATTKYGGSVAKMTADVKAGNVTSKEFFDLILKALPTLQGQAAQATTTFGQAMQTLQTSLVQYIGQTDASLQITERMAQAIVLLSENLDGVAGAITIVGGVLVTRMVAGLASTAATAALARVQMGLLSAGLAGMSAQATAGAVAMTGLRGAMAFLGGPVGVAVLALTAAVAGLAYVAGDAERENAKLVSTMGGAKDALDEYEKASLTAATASGEAAKAAKENAEKMRQEAKDAITAARALREKAAAAAAAAAAEVKNWDNNPNAERMIMMGTAGMVPGGMTPAPSTVSRVRQEAAQARLEAANKALADAEKRFAEIESRINSPGGGGGTNPKGAKSSGPSAKELADRRTALDLENQLLIARARGNEAEIMALEEKQELLRMVEQFERTGLKTAEARARAEEVMTAKTYARLQYYRDNPTIFAGDNRVFDPSQDTEFVKTEDSGLWVGSDNFEEQQDQMREGFKDALRGGLEAGFQEGWPGVAEYIGQSLRQRLLDNLIDVMANIAFPTGGNGSGGGILAAGASIFKSIFGGGRAVGGPVSPGRIYRVNENGQEFFQPLTAGKVIPAGQLGVPAGAAASAAPVYNFTTVVHADDAVLAGQIRQEIAQAHIGAVQSARQLARADAGAAANRRLGRR